MTYEQALSKLTAVCAKGEHCIHEMRTRMTRWQMDEDTQRRVIEYLLNERYIDETRYTKAFINEKIKYNHWGVRKIEQALYMKRIPKDVYAPLLADVSDSDMEDTLSPLLASKRKTVKGSSPYEIRMKLIRFAMQRGFSYEQAERCLDRMGEIE